MADPDLVDQAVLYSLPLPLQCACRPAWVDVVDPIYGWDGAIAAYRIEGEIATADLAAARAVVEQALVGPTVERLRPELVRLRASTIARDASASDLAFVFSAYADGLAEYPQDIVIDAMRWWGRNEKWWPALVELRLKCEQRSRRRRALYRALMQLLQERMPT